MKRVNKITKSPYKQGDKPTVDDLPLRQGKLFQKYNLSRKQKNGFFSEKWVTEDKIYKLREGSKKYVDENLKNKYKKGLGTFEMNTSTGKKWNKGEKCPERGYFYGYTRFVKTDGYIQMWFYKTFDQYERKRIKDVFRHKSQRSNLIGVPFNLDIDYVVEIFPKDYLCPILKTKMKWSNHRRDPHSPSLDRLVPEIGYIKGNVEWISNRANTIKNNATFEEVKLIYEWFKGVS